jgi:uncharacterized membrane protein
MAQTTPMEQTGKRLVFEDSIEIQAPVQEVYRRFSDFTRFPDFMSNVNEVRPTGENRYHWVARIFGIKQEWDAEVTEREQNRRLAWRNVNGASNQGTVSFNDTTTGNTLVRLRLEYTPPAGKAGEMLDNLTKTTQREVHEDLENFRRVVTGQMGVHPRDMEPEAAYHGNLEQVLGSLANVAVWGVVGGTIAHFALEALQPRLNNPLNWTSEGRAILLGQKLGKGRSTLAPFAHEQWAGAKIASYIFGMATGASIIASAVLRLMNRKHDSLFVGQWAPSFLALGALARLTGDRGIRTPILGQKASWALATAGLGSIITSAFWHAKGYRRHGLFVGQWAPTLLTAAALARVYNPD